MQCASARNELRLSFCAWEFAFRNSRTHAIAAIREVLDRILGKSVTPIVAETREGAVVNDGILHELLRRVESDSTVIDAECIDNMVASQKLAEQRLNSGSTPKSKGSG